MSRRSAVIARDRETTYVMGKPCRIHSNASDPSAPPCYAAPSTGDVGCSAEGAQEWGADAAAAYDANASDAAGGRDATARPDTGGSPLQIDAAMGDSAVPGDAAGGDDGKTGGGEAGEESDAGPPAIRYTGRFDTSHPDAPEGSGRRAPWKHASRGRRSR